MIRIQVTRSPLGDLLVGVPPEYQPLNLLLQFELQNDPEFLENLIRVAGDLEVADYEIGGDVCWVSISGSKVTVDVEDGARAVTMDRAEFRDALLQFQHLLADPPPTQTRTRPRWQPPS